MANSSLGQSDLSTSEGPLPPFQEEAGPVLGGDAMDGARRISSPRERNASVRERSLLLPRLSCAAILASGFGTLWFVLVLVVGSAVPDAWTGPQPAWPPREEFVVAADGTLLIRSTPRGDPRGARARDLGGMRRDDSGAIPPLEGVYLEGVTTPGRLATSPGWERRLKAFVDERRTGVVWFFVHDGRAEGAGYFVGYDRASNARVGFIGRSGAGAHPIPPGEQFAVRGEMMDRIPYWSSARIAIVSGKVRDDVEATAQSPAHEVYVPSGNRLYLVDLGTGRVRNVFETHELIESLGFPHQSSPALAPAPGRTALVVRTTSEVHGIDRAHRVTRVFTIPTMADRGSFLVWTEVGDGRAVAEFSRRWRTRDRANIAPRMVYRVAPDGAIAERHELALQSGMLKWSDQPESLLLRYALPVPVLLPVVEPFLFALIDQEESYRAAVRAMLGSAPQSLLAVALVSLVLAASAWWRARAFALPRREQVAWPVFVLLLGLPGYVGYRLHRRWPRRVDCARCRARTPIDRGVCAACGTPFPGPIPNGNEIFA